MLLPGGGTQLSPGLCALHTLCAWWPRLCSLRCGAGPDLETQAVLLLQPEGAMQAPLQTLPRSDAAATELVPTHSVPSGWVMMPGSCVVIPTIWNAGGGG